MITDFELLLKFWLAAKVLTSGKPFMNLITDFKHSG